MSQTYSLTLDFNLRRKVLLTYFTDEETGLKKSGNLEKPGEVFNDIELVSARTGIQTLGLTPEPSQLMTEEKMQSSSFCTVFSFIPKSVPFTPNPFFPFCVLCPVGRTPGDCITWTHLPTDYWLDLANWRHWKETEEQWGSDIRLYFLRVLPISVPCLTVVMSIHWLQLLLGRLLCMGSSTYWAPAILFPSFGPGEVMAYCCSHFLGVSPSLVVPLTQAIIL